MERDDFRRRIIQASALLDEDLNVVRTISSLASLPVNSEFNEAALSDESTYADIYRAAISLSQYNIMLNDYAVFQYSFENSRSWRLAYLPNPWISGVNVSQQALSDWEALESFGDLDHEEVTSLVDELPNYNAIPPIRFEYAVNQYKEIAHPVAHFHIGRHTENRWALSRPLEPLTFTMAIIRLYYPSAWNPKSAFHSGREDECLDRRFMRELDQMRLVHEFTNFERQSLHFTAQSGSPSTPANTVTRRTTVRRGRS